MYAAQKFELIYSIGKQVCSAYTGFSKTEILYCQLQRNWAVLAEFLNAGSPYEALIGFSLRPALDVVSYFQLFVGCMIQLPVEIENPCMSNLLHIIDSQAEFDEALTNARMMRALLAVGAKYDEKSPTRHFFLYLNAKRVLAHVLKKYPKYFDLNVMRTNRKSKALRFKPEDVNRFW